MKKKLQKKIGIGFAILIIGLSMMCGCETAQHNKTKNPYVKPKATEESEDNSHQELVQKISDFLECEENTASSIFETLNEQIDGSVISIELQERETNSSRNYLIIVDDTNCTYLAIVGSDYLVEKIYKDNEDGEQIYGIVR